MKRLALVSVTAAFALALAAPALAQGSYPAVTGGCDDTAVVPGQRIRCGGGGWRPGSQVTATFASEPVVVGTATVQGDTTWTMDLTVPTTTTPGRHSLTFSGIAASGEAASVTVPIVVGSATGVTGAQPGAGQGVAVTGSEVSVGTVLLTILAVIGLAALLGSRRRKVGADA